MLGQGLDRGLAGFGAGDPFDGVDPSAVGAAGRYQAGIERATVDQHGARAAFAFTAAVLGAAKTKPFACRGVCRPSVNPYPSASSNRQCARPSQQAKMTFVTDLGRVRWRAVLGVATGTVIGAVATTVLAGWVDWNAVGRLLSPHALSIMLFVVAVALLGVNGWRLVRPHRRPRRPATPLSWWLVAAAAVVIAGITWGATTWLLEEADRAQDRAAVRVEAIKTGLSIGAGAGGVLALLLSVRRQWHQELAASDVSHDASERRVTELYTKAVEQLGSAQAPVRLGGLYALERLAQDNPPQRQTIVNVLCAYLRMPYQPPGEASHDDGTERVQEREVRLAAQRILVAHLSNEDSSRTPDTFWDDIDVDLSGATLIDFTARNLVLRRASFRPATFIGEVDFWGSIIVAEADYRDVTFTARVDFGCAKFVGDAAFNSAAFNNDAFFGGSLFNDVSFRCATFAGDAIFGMATSSLRVFDADSSFRPTTFTSEDEFISAGFDGRIKDIVLLNPPVFAGATEFASAVFHGAAYFRGVLFGGEAHFEAARFSGPTDFVSTTFETGVPQEIARFVTHD